MLTDRYIKNAAAGMHADGGGLYLRVTPKGKKTWVRRTRTAGADTWVKIGEYPQIPLASARRHVISGAVLMADAIALYKSKLSVRRPEQIDWLLHMLADKALTTPRTELMKLLQDKAKTAPVMANRMLTRWKDFFNFCEQQGWIEQNPLAIVQRKFVGGKEKSRERVLSWAEIETLPGATPTQFALWFILLTGLRPTEALWVMRTKRTEKIPTKENPDPAVHWIPRTPLIRWALRNTPAKIPKSHLTLSNYLRRQNGGFTPHDLRRTYATKLNELGVAPHVVEKMLDHKLQGVMAVYNHAEYREERIAAQRLWDKRLLQMKKHTPKAGV